MIHEMKLHNFHRYILVSVLFIGPILIGAFYPMAIAALCGLLAIGTLLLAFEERKPINLGPLELGLIALMIYTAFQVVPLPSWLTAALWSRGHEVWAGALDLAGSPDAWHPMSLEPIATFVEITKLGALIAGVILASAWVRSSGPRPLLMAVACVGISCALIAIWHRLLGVDALFGVFRPIHARGASFSAPLLNANHLAGLFTLCAPIALGLGLDAHETGRRLLWFAGATLMGMVAMLTLSRGGIAALMFGGGLLALHAARAQRSGESRSRRWLWIGVAAIALVSGGAFVALGAVMDEYVTGGSEDKIALWVAAWPMVVAFAPFGIGRGAFETVFSEFNNLPIQATFTHPENLFIQLITELGVIGALGFLALLGLVVVLALRGARRPSVVGAVAGTAAILAHNLVDFSLELPAMALLLCVVLVCATVGRFKWYPRVDVPPRLALGVVTGMVLACASVAAWSANKVLEYDEDRLQSRARAETPTHNDELARELVARHPADYLVPHLIGMCAARSGQDSPLSWFRRSMERNPRWGAAHLWAGRVLANSGVEEQALLEYRRAYTLEPQLARVTMGAVVRRWRTYQALRTMTNGATSLPAPAWDELCRELTRQGLHEDAALANEELLEAYPNHVPAVERAARGAIDTGRLDDARELAQRIPRGDVHQLIILLAIEAQESSPAAATKTVKRHLIDRPDDPALLRALVEYSARAGDYGDSSRALDRLEHITPYKRLSSVVLLRARIAERRHQHQVALQQFERAEAIGGGRVALLGIARNANRLGRSRRALQAYRRLEEQGSSEEIATEMRRLQQHIHRLQTKGNQVVETDRQRALTDFGSM